MGAQTEYSDAPTIGFEGTLDADYPHTFLTMKNVEASASIAFGRAVAHKTSGATSDMDALLPASENDILAGIAVKIESHQRAWTTNGATIGDLDENGVKPGYLFKCATSGRALVKAAKAVKPGDPLWVRANDGDGAGTTEYLGGLENADDSTDTIQVSKSRWRSTAAAGGLAWLEFDFR